MSYTAVFSAMAILNARVGERATKERPPSRIVFAPTAVEETGVQVVLGALAFGSSARLAWPWCWPGKYR